MRPNLTAVSLVCFSVQFLLPQPTISLSNRVAVTSDARTGSRDVIITYSGVSEIFFTQRAASDCYSRSVDWKNWRETFNQLINVTSFVFNGLIIHKMRDLFCCKTQEREKNCVIYY